MPDERMDIRTNMNDFMSALLFWCSNWMTFCVLNWNVRRGVSFAFRDFRFFEEFDLKWTKHREKVLESEKELEMDPFSHEIVATHPIHPFHTIHHSHPEKAPSRELSKGTQIEIINPNRAHLIPGSSVYLFQQWPIWCKQPNNTWFLRAYRRLVV